MTTICHAASPKNNRWPTLIFIDLREAPVHSAVWCDVLLFATHHYVNHKSPAQASKAQTDGTRSWIQCVAKDLGVPNCPQWAKPKNTQQKKETPRFGKATSLLSQLNVQHMPNFVQTTTRMSCLQLNNKSRCFISLIKRLWVLLVFIKPLWEMQKLQK